MNFLQRDLPEDWQAILLDATNRTSFGDLSTFLESERQSESVLPPVEEVFSAFRYTPFEQVSVLILGQDPYHGPGQAHGLSFSVKPGVKIPPSLRNIYKELQSDLGITAPSHGYLEHWATQGVMMLNAVLTVRQGEANSHKGKGWEDFSDAAISALNAREEPLVFVLWGGYAKKKERLIDTNRHTIIRSGHPSPLSIKHFAGSRPFSKINAALEVLGKSPIDWQIPELE